MDDQVEVTGLVPGERQSVFDYFVKPELIEQWSAPDGMSLRVPFFDARLGGSYRYEHTSEKGVYVCTGHIKEFSPGKRLVMVDTVVDPSGKVILENSEAEITFGQGPNGTMVNVVQKGFKDDKMRRECESSWEQCFDKLISQFRGSEATLH